MQVILKEDVLNLGYKDDIVTVANGYGRNYLIPRGLAVIATESAKKVLAENLKQRAHKLAAIKKQAEEEAAKYEGVKLTIAAKTSKFGVIFGSVTAIQIAEELQKKGFDIDRKRIYLKGGIKEVGEYTCQLRLHKEVQVELPVSVVSENHTTIERKDGKSKAAEEPIAATEETPAPQAEAETPAAEA